ncbi:MAG: helix-turn-helix domain-containing protein [Proteobacteria bacterium]|nr:helix-turn-helix domain-containing protein [Pseudomonadota bacterium]
MVRTRKLTVSETGLRDADAAGVDVDSLRRGLEVLRLFDTRHRSLQLTEIASKLDLSRTTAGKLVATLEAHNFLRANGHAGYVPHVACLALGRAAKRGLCVVPVALPRMRELSRQFDMHVSLTTRDRLDMLVVEHCVPPGKLPLGLMTGTRLPMSASASGRAYLWAQAPAMRSRLMEHLKDEDDDASFKLMSGLYAAFQELEEQGWCFLSSPVTSQTSSIATPIRFHGGAQFSLAVMAVGPAPIEQKLREDVAPELLATAGQIAQACEGMPE